MILGGIQKNSLIDYPAKISCVVFTAGCNFRCPYCHNPNLVIPPFQRMDTEAVLAFILRRKSLLDGVVITGGEPTLQEDLLEFCQTLQDMGLPVKLDTNGSHPQVVKALLADRLINYIAMDIKTLPENYPAYLAPSLDPKNISASIQLILESGLPHEFRTTCVNPFVDEQIIGKLARLLQGADLFAFQNATINSDVLNPDFFHDKEWKISETRLNAFASIAAPFVKSTLIR